MKLRYFAVDACGQLRKVRRKAVQGLWDGCRRADTLGCPVSSELRLISVVCDNDLLPQKVYVLRLPLTDGLFTEASLLTLRMFSRRDCITAEESVRHHTEGWPADFFGQLAVALDVPVAALHVPLGVGGPLMLAAAMRLSLCRVLRHLH